MSKQTDSENGGAMIEQRSPSRRAALGALASIPVLALPIGPAAAAPVDHANGPDAALFALIAAAQDLNKRWMAACEAAEEIEDRTEAVLMPKALIVTEEDMRLYNFDKDKKVGVYFDEYHLEHMAKRREHIHNSKYLRPYSSILADAPATLDEKDRAILQQLGAAERGRIS